MGLARLVWMGLPAFVFVACAGADPVPEESGDAGSGDTRPTPDMADSSPMDAEVDTQDIAVEVEPDMGCEGECCPAQRRCAAGDEPIVEICNDEAMWEGQAPCPAFEVCEDGACVVRCEPGQALCRDAENRQTCDVGGMSWTSQRCEEGRCIGGECTQGALTSVTCTQDDECAGRACLCKGDRACPDGILSDGYCTTADCAIDGCEVAREVCVDFELSGAFGGGNHCVRYCADCPFERGLLCRSLPVRRGEEIVWEDGCFADYPRDTGAKCGAGADCIGGACWQEGMGPSDGFGYCTFACDSHEDCPGNASCVKFPGIDGFFCGVHCGDGTPGSGSCPENRGVATRCNNLESFDGRGLIYICEPVRN